MYKKVFRINQPASGWTETTRSIVGVRVEDPNICDETSLKLSITVITGAHLHIAGFVALLRGPLSEFVKKAAKYYNKSYLIKPEVRTGQHGQRTFILNRAERRGLDFFRSRREQILYVSSHDKIKRVECFLPDLIPFLPLLNEEGAEDVEIQELEMFEPEGYFWFNREKGKKFVDEFLFL